jgi:DNA polymerase family A
LLSGTVISYRPARPQCLQLIVAQRLRFAPVAVSSSTRRMSSRLAAAASASRGRTDAGSATPLLLLRAAALSQDAGLIAAVEAGDAHLAIAKTLFNATEPTAKQRALAKTVNFGVLYGMGAPGLARRLHVNPTEARSFLNAWWERFPALRRYRDRVSLEERRSPWGRLLPHENVPTHIALNPVIQATGRDIFCDSAHRTTQTH